MDCPSCGRGVEIAGVFPGASVQCTGCGTSVKVGGPAQGKMTPAPVASPRTSACPRCNGDLEMRDAEGAVVSSCSAGHGLFVTHSTLRKLQEMQETPTGTPGAAAMLDTDAPRPEGETRTLLCPRCGDAMTRRAFSRGSVVVDVCGEHGTWFDAGELTAALTRRASKNEERAADAVEKQAKATLDVALALEEARDADTARRTAEIAEDVIDLFNLTVLDGKLGYRRKHRL